jgi:hypothetical protein
MHPDGIHPSPHQLTAFDAGLLPPGDHEAVERHVSECPVCCRFLECLPDDALAVRIRAFAGQSTARAGETPPPEAGNTPAPTELPDDLRTHPRYRVLGFLGRGGMGTVYRALQINLDRIVALKVLHRQLTDRPGFADRFHGEVKALARLNHPNVVAAYDADRAGDLHFLVMEFVEGESLEAVIARRGPLPVGEACALVQQAARGLQHAHAQGLIHRDIKPANVLLTSAGTIKVADFGLARLSEAEQQPSSGSAPLVLGTPEYMPPEQALEPSRTDIRSDLYALGCTFYFLLSGRPPFLGISRLQTLLNHQDTRPPTIPGLPAPVAAILNRLLAKQPGERFSTPAEVVDALAGVSAPPKDTAPAPSARRRHWLWALGGGLLTAAVAGGVLAFGPRKAHEEVHAPPPTDPAGSVEPVPHVSALPLAPAPRLVDRLALASPEQSAASRKLALQQASDWVRMNNKWHPNHDFAERNAARLETAEKGDGVVLMFGGGLLKSEKPVLLSARTGGFFVFELTPEQADGAGLTERGSWYIPFKRSTDARRAAPGVRLSDFRIADSSAHKPEARLEVTVTCDFPTTTGANDFLMITDYPKDGLRMMYRYNPKKRFPPGQTTLQFTIGPLESRTGKADRLVILYAEWVSEPGATRVIESNTEATLLLFTPP